MSGSGHVRRSYGPFPRWFIHALAVVLFVVGFGSFVRVPFHSVGPGPATDVLRLVRVTGATTYPSDGQLLLTTASVSNEPLTIWGAIAVWVDPNHVTVPRRRIVLPGFSDAEQDAQNLADMELSKLAAELAAFDALGMEAVRLRGARVLSIVPGSPSDGILEERDHVVAVDGRDVRLPSEAVEAIRAHRPGTDVAVTVRRGGRERVLTVPTVASSVDPARATVGAFLGSAYRLPAGVEIDTQEIGGPSGGLVFALALVDALTEEDLTRGHVIAATGTLERREGVAVVGDIGAIDEKVRSAHVAGASVFLVPRENLEAALAAAPDGLMVIGVSTLREAIDALRGLPATELRPAA